MPTFLIEIPRAGTIGAMDGTMLLNPDHIAAVVPAWDADDVWTHCEIILSNGVTLRTTLTLEEVDEAFGKQAGR